MRITAVLLSLFLAAAARGEESPLERARALAGEAQTEYDLGHYELALKRFEELYKLKPVAGVLFNVAQCHRKLGQLKDAANLYRSFLVHADPESKEAAKAQELLSQVEDALRQQEALAKAPPQGTAPLAPVAKPVVAVEPPPKPLPIAAAPKPQPPPPEKPASHKAAWVLGGVAVAAVAAGAVIGSQSKTAGNQLAQGTAQSQAQASVLYDDYKSKAKVADVLFAASVALALGAVIAW